MDVLFGVIGVIGIMAGLAGIFLPFLPGIPLAWLGVFIYAIGTGFERLSVAVIVGLGIGMAVISIMDFLAPVIGAKRYRASTWGMLGAAVGGLIGIIFLNIWGIVIGPMAGAFIAELLAGKRGEEAWRSALGAFVGFIAGTLVKLVYVIVLVGFFIASWF